MDLTFFCADPIDQMWRLVARMVNDIFMISGPESEKGRWEAQLAARAHPKPTKLRLMYAVAIALFR